MCSSVNANRRVRLCLILFGKQAKDLRCAKRAARKPAWIRSNVDFVNMPCRNHHRFRDGRFNLLSTWFDSLLHVRYFSTGLKHTGDQLANGSAMRSRYQVHLAALSETAEDLNSEEWKTVEQDVLTLSRGSITKHYFDGACMVVFMRSGNHKLAKSLLKYLKTMCRDPSMMCLAAYMALCGSKVSEAGEKEVLWAYESLSHATLDHSATELIIRGLCATSQWREALNVLEKRRTLPLFAPCWDSIISAAFQQDDVDCSWSLIQDMTARGYEPSQIAVQEGILAATRLLDSDRPRACRDLEHLLEFHRDHDLLVSQETASLLKCHFDSDSSNQHWKSTFGILGRNGVCRICGHQLEASTLTDEDFQLLKNAVLTRVLQGSDIFLASTPKEFERYREFISKHHLFDIIVDGLNVAYLKKGHNTKLHAQQLLAVVRTFTEQSKSVLVLGRKHMKRWPAEYMRPILSMATCFFVDDLSRDDAFLLCATLESGKDTHFVSRDLMRDHKYLLHTPALKKLFNHWRQLRQFVPLHIPAIGNVRLLHPVKHRVAVHGSNHQGWHIPYDDGIQLEPHEVRSTWLCVKKIQT